MTPPRRRPGDRRLARPAGRAALVILIALAACARQAPGPTWAGVEARIAAAFPRVPSISTAALDELIQDPARPVVLIDVREPGEFAVSHLRGAVRATSLDHAAALVDDATDGATIVAYCTVGYRSAELVAALRNRGRAEIYNLEGSIFRWANEDRPLYRGDLPVRHVHPFDASWGVLLHADRRAYSPRAGFRKNLRPPSTGPPPAAPSSSSSTGGR